MKRKGESKWDISQWGLERTQHTEDTPHGPSSLNNSERLKSCVPPLLKLYFCLQVTKKGRLSVETDHW